MGQFIGLFLLYKVVFTAWQVAMHVEIRLRPLAYYLSWIRIWHR